MVAEQEALCGNEPGPLPYDLPRIPGRRQLQQIRGPGRSENKIVVLPYFIKIMNK
jgi:hypothetical protein